MKILLSLFLFLLFCGEVSAQTNAEYDSINQNIANEYPFFRRVGATYSTIFGGMAIWQGGTILNNDKPGHDNFLAAATILVGGVRLADGAVHLFRQGEAERMANNNQIKDRATLKRLADDSFKIRLIRSGLIYANSTTFLALFATGDDDYKMLIYPGMIMGVIATVNLFRKTPEEKVFANSISMVPVKNGGALVYNFTF